VGFLFSGKCYATAADATDAFYGGQGPTIGAGSPAYVSQPFKEGAVWKIYNYTSGAGGLTFVGGGTAPTPSFAGCDPAADFLDGVVIGWGIAAAMVVAACIKMMQRGR